MIKSMTGFGRGEAESEGKKFTLEIRTVNHRYSDISIRMPRNYSALEDKVREQVQSIISRGKIDIYINYSTTGLSDRNLVFDEVLGDEYVVTLNQIKERYGLEDNINLNLITRLPDVVKLETKEEDLDEIWVILENALRKALDNLLKMRINEGQRLKIDILDRLNKIKERVKHIEGVSPQLIEEYRKRLHSRINELIKDSVIDETRLAMEVALYADRCAIDEEIVRLYSHIEQVKSSMDISDPIGRKLDFLVQEMNREINTIGSKSSDINIINNVVEIKSELEKIREQIQNIE